MRSFFSHVLLLGVLSGTCLGKCYYPNGGEASNDLPCDPDAEVSVCCGAASIRGYACLANKLCQSTEGKIIRGACTDPTWRSPDCPQFCQNVDYKGHDLVSCSNVTNTDTSYCCDGVSKCCDSGVGRMDIQPPNAGIWAAWDADSDAYVVRAPLSSKVSSTSTSTSTSTTSTTEETETSATGTTGTTGTTGSTTPTDTASGPSPDDQSDKSDQSTNSGNDASTQPTGGLSTGAQAGIGVGAAAGVILLAALAFMWWKYKRLQAQTAAAAAAAEASQGQGPYDPLAPVYSGYYPPGPVHSSYYPQDYELAAAEKRQELYGGGPRAAELPAHNAVSPTLYADSPVMGR